MNILGTSKKKVSAKKKESRTKWKILTLKIQ